MPWEIREDPQTEIVEMTLSGRIPAAELVGLVKSLLNQAEARERIRVLTDLTGLDGGHGIFDLYTLADEIHRRGLAGRFHEAVILPKAAVTAELAKFWETACTNRGIDVRLFSDVGSGREWLSTTGESRPPADGSAAKH